MTYYLAIDTGGTNIKYALMDENATILEKGDMPTPKTSLNAYIQELKTIYEMYKSKNPQALVMSAPGKIDARNGYFYTGGACWYLQNTDLKSILEQELNIPVSIENDAKCAALAELWKGSMQDVDNGIVITLGTGVGGALIINHDLYRGSTFAAGEFSGIPVNWNSRVSGTGDVWAVINNTNNLLCRYAIRKGLDPECMNGKVFFEAVNNSDPDALRELQWFSDTLAAGIYALQLILDVEKVSLGGGISLQPALIASIQDSIDDLFARIPSGSPAHQPEIEACTFCNDANLIGALSHYFEQNPERKPKAD